VIIVAILLFKVFFFLKYIKIIYFIFKNLFLTLTYQNDTKLYKKNSKFFKTFYLNTKTNKKPKVETNNICLHVI
jgi:hypothetical protein